MDPPPLKSGTSAAVEVIPAFHDIDGRYVGVVLIKQRWKVTPLGGLSREEGAEIRVSDEWWFPDEPETSSIKYPSDLCLQKPSTDVLIVGSAISRGRTRVPEMDVTVRVGPVQKRLRVIGPRAWYRAGRGRYELTAPEPFEAIPVQWEKAWGGSDYESDPENPIEEPRNPNGVGVVRLPEELEGTAGPNIEDPEDLVRTNRASPKPAGFGAIKRAWAPRRDYVGTYDEEWMETRMPLLPLDFDARFNQSAPPDQVTPRPLRGGERVEVVNMHEDGPFAFELPKIHWFVGLQTTSGASEHPPQLDTVVLEPNARRVEITWRSTIALPRRAADLDFVQVHEKRLV